MPTFVLHIDVDQFIAAVEMLRHPELQGKPVVVGGTGDPTRRGVVATASYEARKFGITSAMPLRTAARRCPEAVFLPVDEPAYRAASEDVMNTLASFPGTLQVAGWDEAFLRVETDDPESVALAIQRAVRAQTSLECSVGIGQNKLQAKIAAGLAKPAGVVRLTRENWSAVMDRRATDALWGIGRKRARQLAEIGIMTVGDLARAEKTALSRRFGPNTGPWLRALARGEDDSPVTGEPYQAKSRGREVTYQTDLVDAQTIRQEVERLAGQLEQDLRKEGRWAIRVTVKVRFAPFVTHTHSVSLEHPTTNGWEIGRAAMAALDRFELDRPIRLLGVRADLSPSVEPRA
jgi:DNA polymerase-4